MSRPTAARLRLCDREGKLRRSSRFRRWEGRSACSTIFCAWARTWTSGQHPVLAWAPDGRTILFSGLGNVGEKYRLYALSVDTGDARPISTPGENDQATHHQRASDVKWLGVRARYLAPRNRRGDGAGTGAGDHAGWESRWEVPGAALAPRSPIWLEDGKRLLFADAGQIFEWDRKLGTTVIYAADGALGGVSLGPRKAGGEQLVAALERWDPDIWAMPLDAHGRKATGPAHVLIGSTAPDSHPDYSPDGRCGGRVSPAHGAARRRSGWRMWTAAMYGS